MRVGPREPRARGVGGSGDVPAGALADSACAGLRTAPRPQALSTTWRGWTMGGHAGFDRRPGRRPRRRLDDTLLRPRARHPGQRPGGEGDDHDGRPRRDPGGGGRPSPDRRLIFSCRARAGAKSRRSKCRSCQARGLGRVHRGCGTGVRVAREGRANCRRSRTVPPRMRRPGLGVWARAMAVTNRGPRNLRSRRGRQGTRSARYGAPYQARAVRSLDAGHAAASAERGGGVAVLTPLSSVFSGRVEGLGGDVLNGELPRVAEWDGVGREGRHREVVAREAVGVLRARRRVFVPRV